MATPAAADDILFFIPDIGGFTKFIAETEIQHSQHIVQEILELLVDANTLGMKVGEFEGDPVLFYRNGAPPSLEQLVQQARTMYLDFHSHLKKFEYHRICQCGACAGAAGIALKMVAHFGSAGTMRVKDHVKFVGKDIIIAHRLLKNSVTEPEYLLISGQTLSRIGNANGELSTFAKGSDSYDNLGTIDYQVKLLDGYKAEVKVELPLPPRLKNPRKMTEMIRKVDAPIELIYQRLIDLPGRMNWMDAISKVEMSDDLPNQIGKVHRCVRGDDPGIAVTTTEVKVTDATMELWETDLKQMSACRYLLTRLPDDKANFAVEFYVRDNLIIRLMFRMLMEKKLKASFERSMANLAALCEKEAR
jgi:Protein of unknown function (DUF2652)/Polyketide cyclase / dehydrase and lipid transport